MKPNLFLTLTAAAVVVVLPTTVNGKVEKECSKEGQSLIVIKNGLDNFMELDRAAGKMASFIAATEELPSARAIAKKFGSSSVVWALSKTDLVAAKRHAKKKKGKRVRSDVKALMKAYKSTTKKTLRLVTLPKGTSSRIIRAFERKHVKVIGAASKASRASKSKKLTKKLRKAHKKVKKAKKILEEGGEAVIRAPFGGIVFFTASSKNDASKLKKLRKALHKIVDADKCFKKKLKKTEEGGSENGPVPMMMAMSEGAAFEAGDLSDHFPEACDFSSHGAESEACDFYTRGVSSDYSQADAYFSSHDEEALEDDTLAAAPSVRTGAVVATSSAGVEFEEEFVGSEPLPVPTNMVYASAVEAEVVELLADDDVSDDEEAELVEELAVVTEAVVDAEVSEPITHVSDDEEEETPGAAVIAEVSDNDEEEVEVEPVSAASAEPIFEISDDDEEEEDTETEDVEPVATAAATDDEENEDLPDLIPIAAEEDADTEFHDVDAAPEHGDIEDAHVEDAPEDAHVDAAPEDAHVEDAHVDTAPEDAHVDVHAAPAVVEEVTSAVAEQAMP